MCAYTIRVCMYVHARSIYNLTNASKYRFEHTHPANTHTQENTHAHNTHTHTDFYHLTYFPVAACVREVRVRQTMCARVRVRVRVCVCLLELTIVRMHTRSPVANADDDDDDDERSVVRTHIAFDVHTLKNV